jgi:ribosomal protein S18 acetylase RimI-like enzyme
MAAVVVLDLRDPGTAASVVKLQRASYGVEADLIGYSDLPPLLETTEQVAHLDLTVLGALTERQLLGILGYRRTSGTVEIDRLAVHPSCFRQGFARSLIRELHRREVDAARFEVSTGAENLPAVACYTRLGYRREGDEVLPMGLTIAHFARP